jgi:flagella basal body P-ring formation protein FlgA
MTNLLFILILMLFPRGISEGEIHNYLEANLINYDSFSYRLLQPLQDTKGAIQIDMKRNFILKNRYGYIPVVIEEGKVKRKSIIPVRLKLMQKVLVANRTIKRGERLSAEDVKLTLKDVTDLKFKPINRVDEISGMQARTNIYDGKVLTSNMIEKGKTVFAGNKVTAVYQNGVVEVTFPAVVRIAGRVGDVIRVKRDDGIILKAKVINNKEVEIVE